MENFLPNTDFNLGDLWRIVLNEWADRNKTPYNPEAIEERFRLMEMNIRNLMQENDSLRMHVTTLREESLLQQRRMEDAERRCSEVEGQVADLTNELRNHLNFQQLDNAETLISNIPRGDITNTDMDTSQEDDYEEMVLVRSTGAAAEHQGDCMGVFLLAGEHNNRPYYRQKHTLNTQGARFLYSHENGNWYVGKTLGASSGRGLKNTTQTASVPTSGWQYGDADSNTWLHDPALTVTPLSALSSATCSSITISAKGEAARKVADYLGTFTPTGNYSCGRQVFSSDRGRYLMVPAGWSSWYVQDSV